MRFSGAGAVIAIALFSITLVTLAAGLVLTSETLAAGHAPDVSVTHATSGATVQVRIDSPVPLRATFSEPVFGFEVNDITVVNGSTGDFAGSDGDSVYTFSVTPNAVGMVTVDVAAGVAEDADANGNTAADSLNLGVPYDDDHDGMIGRPEVIEAVVDYFSGYVTRDHVIGLIILYFSRTASTPDLIVGTPTVSDSNPSAGALFTLSAMVENAGDGESEATTLRYYRSTDATINGSDTEEGTDEVDALAAAGGSDQSIDLTAPSTPGAYYYGACVDAVTDESDTTNNCSAPVKVDVQGLAPNLQVETPSVNDAGPEPGATFTLSATVVNAGDAASAATTLRYYRSTDARITTSDTQEGTDAVGALAASGIGAESILLTAPSTAGTYYYGACVDAVTDESDTTDNCSSSVKVDVKRSTTTRTTHPDLEVRAPTVYETTLGPEAPFTMYATVTNAGDGASAATTLRYYLSTDATITTADTQVGTDAIGSLAADGASDQSIDLTAPSTMATYYYGACVDSVSGESDTTNNCSSSVQITMESPDLLFDGGAQLGPLLSTDGLFRIVVGVENRGKGKSAPTTIRFYRSTDTTITTSDTELESQSQTVESLRSGRESTHRTSWLAPPSALGDYFHGACWDPVPGESNTANNCSTYFTARVRPNLEVPEVGG